MTSYRAIIFDMDGVLVDSEPLFIVAINRLLAAENVAPVTPQENQTLLGTTVEETWRRLQQLRSLPQPLPYYLERYDPIVRQVLAEEMQPQPGVARLLDSLRERGLPAAVASSSLRSWVDLKLNILGLHDAFAVVLGGDDVARGKPAPDIYQQAASGLGLRPQQCLAIEDSPPGIAAAVDAGCYTVAVRTSSTAGMDITRAHVILDSLEEFDLSLLDSRAVHAD